MSRAGAALALACVACGGGARTGWRAEPGKADVRSYYYTDNSGVSVTSLAASATQPVSERVTAEVRALGEQIVLRRKPLDVGDPGANQSTGHPPHTPDAVTSASATAGGGEVKEELRAEGVGAVVVEGDAGGAPGSLRTSLRGSAEPDYRSIYGSTGGSIELAERNTTVTAFAGLGRDWVRPVEAPPGQMDEWPAHHDRLNGGASVSQILSPRLLLSGGAGVTHQRGQLANPYRRALVRTTLFPEVVPDTRTRATAFAGLSWYLGWDAALHLRQGFYADSWEVLAIIPEVAVAREMAPGLLASLRYRFYKQSRASFYEGRYDDLEEHMTGDARLGPIQAHDAGAEASWYVLGESGEYGALALRGEYTLSLIDYQLYATDVIVGHVLGLGAWLDY